MNKIDAAWVVLKSLPPREQEIVADAIIEFAAADHGLALSDIQVEEVRRRLSEKSPKVLSKEEVQRRIARLLK